MKVQFETTRIITVDQDDIKRWVAAELGIPEPAEVRFKHSDDLGETVSTRFEFEVVWTRYVGDI